MILEKCNKEQQTEDKVPPIWAGAAAQALAATPMHPFDIIKVQLQVSRKLSFKQAFKNIIDQKGYMGLTYGLSASVTRQITYATARFGIYENLKAIYKRRNKPIGVPDRIWMSCIAGALGGLIANPPDMINVRMLNDFAQPPEKRRNYKHVFHGLYSVVKENGFLGLYKGVSLTMMRACIFTTCIFTSYDTYKAMFIRRFGLGDDPKTHFMSSVCATSTAIMISQPVDVMRTRIMSSKGVPRLQVITDIYKKNGIFGYWKGLIPTYARIGPMNIMMYVFFEFFRINFGYYVERIED
ncbi:mitochondrial dicarboxylate carrier-like [Chrysoperla carnea]|uniref:mitochondrial dicarboxylate carrier-like n=1 Tax=Chrysoperla carnea TaxID=189513 RepID=UPI001D061E00|nr:mitochondrial dicarboxylate carrier-like [Chrysoperla carnea]